LRRITRYGIRAEIPEHARRLSSTESKRIIPITALSPRKAMKANYSSSRREVRISFGG
jgi:hypothetical protein